MATIKIYPGVNSATLRHPSGGGQIRARGSEWPSDSFTHRRIADGSVLLSPGGVTADVGTARQEIIENAIAREFPTRKRNRKTTET